MSRTRQKSAEFYKNILKKDLFCVKIVTTSSDGCQLRKGATDMNGYFLVLFINNRICQYRIDELIQNSTNGLVSESLVFGNKNVYLPLSIQQDVYCIQNKSTKFKVRCGNQMIEDCRPLCHGDYFVIQNEHFAFSLLVLNSNQLPMGASIYSIGSDNVFIGRSEEMNIVVDINGSVSRKCAAIRTDGDNRYIEDLSGKTGIYVNGKREASCKLSDGDNIYIMGTNIVYYSNFLIVPDGVRCNLEKWSSYEYLAPVDVGDEEEYVRTPRIIKSEEQGTVVIDTPPAPQRAKDLPFILSVGPAMTMSLAMLASLGVTISNAINGSGGGSLITSSVMAVSMLAGALLWPGLLRRYNKKQEQKNEAHRVNRYTSYLRDKEIEIKGKYERNVRILNENLMPSPRDLSDFIQKKR